MSESKKNISQNESLGSVHIAEEVIASIAALAAVEVDGVGALSSNVGHELAELLGKKNLSKGVKIAVSGNMVAVDVYILVKRSHAIIKVSQAVQESVKSSVESMTGLQANVVNVHVVGIAFDRPVKK